MRKIVLYPAKILREVLPRVTAVDEKLIRDTADLSGLLEKSDNGAGLAANQIGSRKRFFGLKNGQTKKADIFINPRIVQSYGLQKVYLAIKLENGEEEDFLEGCLSFPDYFGTVKRFLKKIMNGFEAIVFQHEADHLDGILFIDHIKRDGGKFYKWAGKEKILWSIDKVIEGKL
jgi:peptide deformylase